MAIPPPQYDVFDILREGEGSEVIVPIPSTTTSTSTSNASSKPRSKSTAKAGVQGKKEKEKEKEKMNDPKHTGVSSSTTASTTTTEKNKEFTNQVDNNSTANTTANTAANTNTVDDENDWTVVEDRRHKHQPSLSTEPDHTAAKKRGPAKTSAKSSTNDNSTSRKLPAKSSKMSYKQAIQKSMPAKLPPPVVTGQPQQQQQQQHTSSSSSSVSPEEKEKEKKRTEEEPKTKKEKEENNQTQQPPKLVEEEREKKEEEGKEQTELPPLSSSLPNSLQPVISLTPFEENKPLEGEPESSQLPPISGMAEPLPLSESVERGKPPMQPLLASTTSPFGNDSYPIDYPSNSMSFGNTDRFGMNYDTGYDPNYNSNYDPYFSYSHPYSGIAPIRSGYPNDEWWPKTHYNAWREREVGLERGLWFGEPSGYRGSLVGEDEMAGYNGPNYTSEELQVGLKDTYFLSNFHSHLNNLLILFIAIFGNVKSFCQSNWHYCQSISRSRLGLCHGYPVDHADGYAYGGRILEYILFRK